MTTKHIRRVVVLGVIVEAVAAVAAAYELLRVVCWIGEHLPDWMVPVGLMAIPAGLMVYLWRWYRETVEREAAEQEEGEDNALL